MAYLQGSKGVGNMTPGIPWYVVSSTAREGVWVKITTAIDRNKLVITAVIAENILKGSADRRKLLSLASKKLVQV